MFVGTDERVPHDMRLTQEYVDELVREEVWRAPSQDEVVKFNTSNMHVVQRGTDGGFASLGMVNIRGACGLESLVDDEDSQDCGFRV